MNVVALNNRQTYRRENEARKSGVIAALDIGSTKICCMIAKLEERPNSADKLPAIKVLGVGHHGANGIKAGSVINVDQAERAIRLAVDAAERMAQTKISEVFVNVSGGRPVCLGFNGSSDVAHETIAQGDINNAIGNAMKAAKAQNRVVLHASPVTYEVDGAKGITDPRGMYGSQLSVDINSVLVEASAMRNLALVIERCHLSVAGFVIAPYAAGRSVLDNDEMELGTTLVDMGGATTSVAVFFDGNLVYGDVVPVGGHHITKDLARGLSTTIAHAERIKTLYGSALPSIYDDRELISVPLLGERGVDKINQVPRSMLTGIIRPRLEEIFELMRDRLQACPVVSKMGRQLVLSGGASQLSGMREAAGQIMSQNVRVAAPRGFIGLPESSKSAAFSVATGLLSYATNPDKHTSAMIEFSREAANSNHYFNRVGRWFKESF